MNFSDGVAIFVDLRNNKGLEECQTWLNRLRLTAKEGTKFIVVGNIPQEHEREIPLESALQFARKYDLPYAECCIETGDGIDMLRK